MKQSRIQLYLLGLPVASLLLGICISCSMSDVVEGGMSSGGATPDVPNTKLEASLGFAGTEVVSRAIYDGVGLAGADCIGKVHVSLASFADGGYSSYADSNTSAVYTAEARPGGAPGELIWREDRAVFLSDNNAVVFGYAPLEGTGDVLSGDPSITPSDVTIGDLVIKADQTFDATDVKRNTCNQTDYLFATRSSVRATPVQDIVSRADRHTILYLHHSLARVSFKVRKGEGEPAVDEHDFVKKIKLFSDRNDFRQGTGVRMSLVDGTLSGTVATDTLSFSAETGKALQLAAFDETGGFAGVPCQLYGLVAPLVETDKRMGMELTVGNNDGTTSADRVYRTGRDQERLSVDWERGKEYIYSVSVTDRALDVQLVQIVDFKPGGEEEFPVD